MEIAGCNALVTGGASGIGAAIATELRARGARVAVADRAGPADITTDLSHPGSAGQMVAGAVEHLGGLDLLVNNAGGCTTPPIRPTTTGARRWSSIS